MTLKNTVIGLGICAAILALLYIVPSRSQSVLYQKDSASYNREYWSEQLRTRGAEAVYKEFKERNKDAGDKEHLSAHVFGELLFEHVGISGIRACDSAFGFGCYHGFFLRAVSSGGTPAISALDAECVLTYGTLGTGCQHGIGHGILEYTGYQNLEQALELCKNTTQRTALLGCTSGVFMEYNTPLAGIAESLVPQNRELNRNAPYEPCTSVSAPFLKSCYFELGQWYGTALHLAYEDAGTLCAGLRGEQRTYCFLGLGASAAFRLSYDMPEGIRVCDTFLELDALSCRAGLSWGFYSVPEHRGEYQTACSLTDEEKTRACGTLSDLTEGLDESRVK